MTAKSEIKSNEDVAPCQAAVTLVILSIQIIFSRFFMSVLGLKTVARKPPGN